MNATDIYNNVNDNHRDFIMDESMDLMMDLDPGEQNKEMAEKLVDKIQSKVSFDESDFTEDEFNQNKSELIDIFAEMILEMNNY